jgi:predicted phosphodiesterase
VADPGARPATAGTRPFALLADIHANAAALEAVLAELDANGIAEALVLGDLVGYGPEPEACVAAIRARGWPTLLGNHDYGVAHGDFNKGFSSLGRRVAEWTAERLGRDDLDWLAALPDTLEGEGWMAVHGAPADQAKLLAYVYRMTYEANLDYLAGRGVRCCFHGHTHIQGVYFRNDRGDGFSEAPVQSIADYVHCLVCPGSVGQPRGRNGTQARYAVVDPGTWLLELKQVDYEVERTVAAMASQGLPEALGQRLLVGE